MSPIHYSFRQAWRSIRSRLVSGLVVLVPVLVTFWVFRFLFHHLDGWLRPHEVKWLGRCFPGIGVLATFLLLYLVGLVTANFVGRGMVRWIERLILRLPLIGEVYGSSKQIMDAVSSPQARGFRKVVSFDYPLPGIRALGFVTREFKAAGGEDLYLIFMPTTPNPTTGFMLYLPVGLVEETGLGIEDAIKMVVSGGVVTPDSFHPPTPEAAPGPGGNARAVRGREAD